MRQLLQVAAYRIRATIARRWGGYLSVMLLVGLLGGLSMGALAGARRTDSSFPVYAASTVPSTVRLFTGFLDPSLGLHHGYNPRVGSEFAHLPGVERGVTTVGFDGTVDLTSVKGIHPAFLPGETPPTIIGGLDGEYVSQDKVTLVAGRRANPTSSDEAVMNAQAARELGVHVGSVIKFPIYTDAEATSSYDGPPYREVRIKLVGEVVFATSVVQDDIDALGSGVVLLSPALTQELASCCAYYSASGLLLRGGAGEIPKVVAEATKVYPVASVAIGGGGEKTPSALITKAQRAIKPEAIALGVFGVLAGLAVLLIAGQLMARSLRRSAADAATLRALGADRSMAFSDVLAGLLAAVVLGALLAAVVAVGLSPLTPLGPVRPVYPYPGVSVDWAVLGLGVAAVIVLLTSLALLLAWREVARLSARRSRQSWRREGRAARLLAGTSLPISASTGVRFALDPGTGSDAVPVRSAILGAVLAVTVLVSTLTFGASLNSLVSHPALFGWNWDRVLLSGFAGQEDLPASSVTAHFNHDPYVSAWSGVNVTGVLLNGQSVPALTEQPGASVAPPLLSGHGLDAANQIVLGNTTLAALHEHVGGQVTLSDKDVVSKPLQIVGTATFPAIAQGFEMGSGALVATSDFPTSLLNAQENPIAGPNAVLIRLRPDVNAVAAAKSLQSVQTAINVTPGDQGSVGGIVTVLRPAEIVNYRTMGTTPAVLGLALALGAVVALGLTLLSSVRRRRRDLAMLKTLGFTQRQLAGAVACQASVAVLCGILVGVPVGIVVGRTLWTLFAREINAVPAPAVPIGSILLVALAAIVVGNLVAAVPGRIAARTPTALILRAE